MEPILANLGDANPLEHGGYFVAQNRAFLLEVLAENKWELYTVSLDRCELSPLYGLIPHGFSAMADNNELTHELSCYAEWFNDSVPQMASFMGMDPEELKAMFCSEDPIKLASAYRAIGDYHGWNELDSYPDKFSSHSGRNALEVRFLGKEPCNFIDYEVCMDCYQFHHGNELESEARELEVASAYNKEQESCSGHFADNTDPECEEDPGITEFSWNPCELCGSSLGGSRYRLAMIVPNKQKGDN